MQTFLEDYEYDHDIINPLLAKKEMDVGLRHNKIDKDEAYHLALIQNLYQHSINKAQSSQDQQLNALSRLINRRCRLRLRLAPTKCYSLLFPRLKNYI